MCPRLITAGHHHLFYRPYPPYFTYLTYFTSAPFHPFTFSPLNCPFLIFLHPLSLL
nr:MAG TPA: hypothetical protein [Caudoviricetes sp.]